MKSDAMPELDWNGPSDRPFRRMTPGFLGRGVFEVFEEAASRWAGRPAIRCLRGVTTHGDLLEWARGIGSGLGAFSGRGGVVGLALPVDRRFPAGMLGALGAGQMYVPLDLSQPGERLAHIMAHSGMGCVLACDETLGRLEGLVPKGCRVMDVDAMRTSASGWQAVGDPGDAAYLLYTSGTTGRPKGVFQDQRGLMHDVMQYTNSVHFSERDATSLLYSPWVNGAIRDIYGALLNGGCLCMVDLKRDGFGAAAARMTEAGITLFHAMPPVLRSLLREVRDPAMMARVRLAYVAGDRLWGSDARLLRQVLPRGSHLYTGIGSTECATLFRQWFVPGDWPVDDGVMPVGYSVPDREVRILGEDGVEVGVGEAGIITVRGRTLARGYWRDEAGTASVFQGEPGDSGWVTFRTGDRGRLRPDGLLEFMGRGDRQVKVRGYRVELVEVEAVMRGVAGVEEAGVVSVGEGDEVSLVGFVQGLGEGDAAVACVATALAERLPSYMRPAFIVGVGGLPRLGNGKPDLGALRIMAERHRAIRSRVEGGHEMDITHPVGRAVLGMKVRDEWRRVLGTAREGSRSTWDALGGDSLRALELTMALEGVLGTRLPASLVEGSMTWQSLADRVAEVTASMRGPGGEPQDEVPLGDLYVVPWAPGPSVHERAFAEAMSPRFRSRVLSLTSLEEEWIQVHSIKDLGRRCADEVCRSTRMGVPICLVGVSFGGRVAMELASQLRGRGHSVAMVGVIDIACKTGFRELARRALKHWAEDAAPGTVWWRRRIRQTRAWMRSQAGKAFGWMAVHRWQGCLKFFSRAILAVLGAGMRGTLLANIRRTQIDPWTVPWHAGELALFMTEDSKALLGGSDPTFGWGSHAESVRIVTVEGNHANCVSFQHMDGLIQRVMPVAIESVARATGRDAATPGSG